MLRKPTKAKGGPVPQRPPAPDFTATDKRAKEVVREMERPLRVALKGCGAAMFVILAFFLIAAIFVPGVIPAKITLSKAALEQKQLRPFGLPISRFQFTMAPSLSGASI